MCDIKRTIYNPGWMERTGDNELQGKTFHMKVTGIQDERDSIRITPSDPQYLNDTKVTVWVETEHT